MPGSSEPWNVQAEFARGRKFGMFPTVKRSELHLAGMSLASITNMPNAAGTDMSQAPGALLDYIAGANAWPAPPFGAPMSSPAARIAVNAWHRNNSHRILL
jgi:hypothetical protein